LPVFPNTTTNRFFERVMLEEIVVLSTKALYYLVYRLYE
jgi:hypothetical protein